MAATTATVHDPIHRTSYAFERDGENLWVDTWFEDETSFRLATHADSCLGRAWHTADGAPAGGYASLYVWATVCSVTGQAEG